MLVGSTLCLHGGCQAANLPDHDLQAWDHCLVTASTPQKHQTMLKKHHISIPTADAPSSGDFGLEKEKQKAQQALEEGECWGLLLSPFWPHVSDPKCKGHRQSLQIKPLATFQGFGCGSGRDGERDPFGKSGMWGCT